MRLCQAAVQGGPRRGDGTSRRSVRRLRCVDRSVEGQVNASLARSGLAEPTTSYSVPT